ncbi:MAG TPA: hypothetical protein VIV35_04905 [Chitinophagaceae bacterium]
MKNPFTWVIFLLITGAILTCTPDDDSRAPQKVAAPVEGFYKDTVTYPRLNIVDSVITKEVVKRNDSTYIMCEHICFWNGFGGVTFRDSVIFTIHPDNTITLDIQYGSLGIPPYPRFFPFPSYYVPSAGYIYIKFRDDNYNNGAFWIERLKKI